jgi:site-specific DNA-methyltransferase (adenine-specific)
MRACVPGGIMSKAGNGSSPEAGKLYFGDNLDWLPKINSESVDLVYLDPPFNSNTNYSVLFRSPVAEDASAQIQAFEDTWSWGNSAERCLDRVRELSLDTFKLLDALRRTFLGESDIMAYLAMMAPRLLELRRVMKPHATLYLHCDPNASHYLKVLLDCIFEAQGFINEISWKRTTAKADYAQGATHYPRVRDVLLVFRRDEKRRGYIQPAIHGIRRELYFIQIPLQRREWSYLPAGQFDGSRRRGQGERLL